MLSSNEEPGGPVLVYLPRPGSRAESMIDKGSGIVGEIDTDGKLFCDFEGNRFDAVNMLRFADRVAHALGRHVERYPTIARAAIPPEELVVVGSYDPREGIVTLDDEGSRDLLATWLDQSELDPRELQASDLRFETRRQVRKMLGEGTPRQVLRASLPESVRRHVQDLLP